MTLSIKATDALNIPKKMDFSANRKIFGHRMIDDQCSALPLDENEYIYALVCKERYCVAVKDEDIDPQTLKLKTLSNDEIIISAPMLKFEGTNYKIKETTNAANGVIFSFDAEPNPLPDDFTWTAPSPDGRDLTFAISEIQKMTYVKEFVKEAPLTTNLPVVFVNEAVGTPVNPSAEDKSVLTILKEKHGIHVKNDDLAEILDDACAPRVYEPLGFIVPLAKADDSVLTLNEIRQSDETFAEPLEKLEQLNPCIDVHLARVLMQLKLCGGIRTEESGGGAAASVSLTLQDFLK